MVDGPRAPSWRFDALGGRQPLRGRKLREAARCIARVASLRCLSLDTTTAPRHYGLARLA
eukprot:15140317-Alexandrium_andersonii.AAC.1